VHLGYSFNSREFTLAVLTPVVLDILILAKLDNVS